MALTTDKTSLTKVGRISIEPSGQIVVEGFDAKNASCRDLAVLACLHGAEVLLRQARLAVEEPGLGNVIVD